MHTSLDVNNGQIQVAHGRCRWAVVTVSHTTRCTHSCARTTGQILVAHGQQLQPAQLFQIKRGADTAAAAADQVSVAVAAWPFQHRTQQGQGLLAVARAAVCVQPRMQQSNARVKQSNTAAAWAEKPVAFGIVHTVQALQLVRFLAVRFKCSHVCPGRLCVGRREGEEIRHGPKLDTVVAYCWTTGASAALHATGIDSARNAVSY